MLQALDSAAGRLQHGRPGLLLNLFAESYYLDHGRLDEAGAALLRAEAIYFEAPKEMDAALATEFVFIHAYVRHDAASARAWWTRLEASKHAHFNVDYWRALGALQWIEGNVAAAQQSWEKSVVEAQKLPRAGAYEYDRYLCQLLGEAIAGGCPVPTAAVPPPVPTVSLYPGVDEIPVPAAPDPRHY